MSADALRSRLRARGAYTSHPLDESGGRQRSSGPATLSIPDSAELRMSSPADRGGASLAQGVQVAVAVSQAGVVAASALERASVQSGTASPPVALWAGEPGGEAAGFGLSGPLADMLAMGPEAGTPAGDSGGNLLAWLDIATGRLALLEARKEESGRPITPEKEEAASAPAQPVVAFWPDDGASSPAEPAQAELGSPLQATADPQTPEAPAPLPDATEERPLTALEQARRSFGAALERLDQQLEPALAAALARLGGSDPQRAADSVAQRMRRDPERAREAHPAKQLPGVLGLLQWDLTPLSQPRPEAAPAPG